MRFEELKFEDGFDAVWACASLLHVAKKQMPGILQLLPQALKKDGILYASFKYGDSERIKDSRFSTTVPRWYWIVSSVLIMLFGVWIGRSLRMCVKIDQGSDGLTYGR